jgi:DNA-binding beta-propeller fold protein YncE
LDANTGGVLGILHLSRDLSASAHAVAADAGAVWVGSGDRVFKVDARTGTLLSRFGVACCFGGVNDVGVGGGSVWVADVDEALDRISRTNMRVTGHATLGVIPGAVTLAYGSAWVALPASVGARIALARVDLQTVQVVDSILVGPSPGPYPPTMEVGAGAGDLWVTNFDLGTLTRVDARSATVKTVIHIGHHPFGVAFGANRIWVTVS